MLGFAVVWKPYWPPWSPRPLPGSRASGGRAASRPGLYTEAGEGEAAHWPNEKWTQQSYTDYWGAWSPYPSCTDTGGWGGGWGSTGWPGLANSNCKCSCKMLTRELQKSKKHKEPASILVPKGLGAGCHPVWHLHILLALWAIGPKGTVSQKELRLLGQKTYMTPWKMPGSSPRTMTALCSIPLGISSAYLATTQTKFPNEWICMLLDKVQGHRGYQDALGSTWK